jgi:hypothetical protein
MAGQIKKHSNPGGKALHCPPGCPQGTSSPKWVWGCGDSTPERSLTSHSTDTPSSAEDLLQAQHKTLLLSLCPSVLQVCLRLPGYGKMAQNSEPHVTSRPSGLESGTYGSPGPSPHPEKALALMIWVGNPHALWSLP